MSLVVAAQTLEIKKNFYGDQNMHRARESKRKFPPEKGRRETLYSYSIIKFTYCTRFGAEISFISPLAFLNIKYKL